MAKAILILISFILVFLFPAQAWAAENISLQELQELGFTRYETINGNSLIYFAKRIGEKVMRVDNQTLLNTRFNELVYIANFRKTGFLAESAERYNSLAGKIALQKNFSPKFLAETRNHIKMLEKLRDLYHSNSLPWIQIKQALETTERLL